MRVRGLGCWRHSKKWVTVVGGRMDDVELPEAVDVIVSNWWVRVEARASHLWILKQGLDC